MHRFGILNVVLCVSGILNFEENVCYSNVRELIRIFSSGTANPAVKPGLAAEFRLVVWLKGLVIRCFGFVTNDFASVYFFYTISIYLLSHFNRKRNNDYEQIVVTPSCPGVDLRSDQMNEENEDFSSRRRYHQTSVIQGHYVDDV